MYGVREREFSNHSISIVGTLQSGGMREGQTVSLATHYPPNHLRHQEARGSVVSSPGVYVSLTSPSDAVSGASRGSCNASSCLRRSSRSRSACSRRTRSPSSLSALLFVVVYRYHPCLRPTKGNSSRERERRRAEYAGDNRNRGIRNNSDRRTFGAGCDLREPPQGGINLSVGS